VLSPWVCEKPWETMRFCPYENPWVDNPWVSMKIKTMGNLGVLAI